MSYNTTACEELCESAPEFSQLGVMEGVCASLKNNTGFNSGLSVLKNNCEDMETALDCLIGRIPDEIESYEPCDWKAFMKDFSQRLYTFLKAANCSDCGNWSLTEEAAQNAAGAQETADSALGVANCAHDGVENLVTALDGTVGGESFVRYFRDNSGTGSGYEWPAVLGESHTLDIYMDCNLDNPGSTPADRDYVVIVTTCTNFHNFKDMEVIQTLYSSGDTRPIGTIRNRQALHPAWESGGATVKDVSWPVTASVVIHTGEHIKIDTLVDRLHDSTGADYRLHQIICTWIPIAPVGGWDLSNILPC